MADRPRKGPGWYVISLRPRGEHGGLRQAAARAGAGLIALSPWRLQLRRGAATQRALAAALAAPAVVFTSPAAVRAAVKLRALPVGPGRQWCAVGAGTAAALRRAGVREVQVPQRMDSEGVLALPVLQALDGVEVGLVTAPGGRDLLAPALEARGARLRRADVYARLPVAPAPTAVAMLCRVDAPLALALSSGDALQLALRALPDSAADRLRSAQVLAASTRLAALASELGFGDITVAAGPRPGQLVAAARLPVAAG
ncbi:uroporphyrinogen-III synthase [Lysobacter korlensis]|uniref:Uroporphyrinogen-III synthase n=1 Tax=Lysobacter korlensis TaxID=553636 RepID=A0ABV6RHL9_9GAMM